MSNSRTLERSRGTLQKTLELREWLSQADSSRNGKAWKHELPGHHRLQAVTPGRHLSHSAGPQEGEAGELVSRGLASAGCATLCVSLN